MCMIAVCFLTVVMKTNALQTRTQMMSTRKIAPPVVLTDDEPTVTINIGDALLSVTMDDTNATASLSYTLPTAVLPSLKPVPPRIERSALELVFPVKSLNPKRPVKAGKSDKAGDASGSDTTLITDETVKPVDASGPDTTLFTDETVKPVDLDASVSGTTLITDEAVKPVDTTTLVSIEPVLLVNPAEPSTPILSVDPETPVKLEPSDQIVLTEPLMPVEPTDKKIDGTVFPMP